MRSASVTVLFVALIGLLAYTNPDLSHYETFLRQRALATAQARAGTKPIQRLDDPRMAEALVHAASAEIILPLMVAATIRHDYVLFSIYNTTLEPGTTLRFLGVLKNFVSLSESRNVDTSSPTPNVPLSALNPNVSQYPHEWLADHPGIQQRMSALLGDRAREFQKNFDTQSPVEVQRKYFVLSGCRPHSCHDSGAILFVAVDKSVIHCAMFRENDLSTCSEDPTSFPHEEVRRWHCGFSGITCPTG